MASPDPRRPLDFADLGAVRSEIARLESAAADGTLVAAGDWTLDQACWHLARFMRMSREGFTFRAPLPLRLAGRFMKGWALGPKPSPRGIRLRGPLSALEPSGPCADGPAQLRGELDAITERGERYTHPSPLLGPLAHEEWVRLHCKHAAHHLGFFRTADAPAGAGPR